LTLKEEGEKANEKGLFPLPCGFPTEKGSLKRGRDFYAYLKNSNLESARRFTSLHEDPKEGICAGGGAPQHPVTQDSGLGRVPWRL